MSVNIQDELNLVLQTAQLTEKISLLAMHLSEVEQEAETVLDVFTTLRSHAYRSDVGATQESLAELTIALEHLLHHLQEALPALQRQLDIEPG